MASKRLLLFFFSFLPLSSSLKSFERILLVIPFCQCIQPHFEPSSSLNSRKTSLQGHLSINAYVAYDHFTPVPEVCLFWLVGLVGFAAFWPHNQGAGLGCAGLGNLIRQGFAVDTLLQCLVRYSDQSLTDFFCLASRSPARSSVSGSMTNKADAKRSCFC